MATGGAGTLKAPPRVVMLEQAGPEGLKSARGDGPLSPIGSIPTPKAIEDVGPPKNIFEAAERGQVGYIMRQVERSLEFDINQRDKYQRTALHWAAELDQREVAEALMDYGIDPAATECNGRTAIHLAAREGHADMLRIITANLTDKEKELLVNQRDVYGITPVYLSLQRGEESRAAFEFLMRCGAKYNSQTPNKVRADKEGSASHAQEAAAAAGAPAEQR